MKSALGALTAAALFLLGVALGVDLRGTRSEETPPAIDLRVRGFPSPQDIPSGPPQLAPPKGVEREVVEVDPEGEEEEAEEEDGDDNSGPGGGGDDNSGPGGGDDDNSGPGGDDDSGSGSDSSGSGSGGSDDSGSD